MISMDGYVNGPNDDSRMEITSDEFQNVSSNRIVKSPDASDHCCLFYAMFNGFREENKRIAFAAKSDGPDYSSAFRKISFDETKVARIAIDGYTASDMLQYLKWLKEKECIKSFKFIKKKNFKLSWVNHRPKGTINTNLYVLYMSIILK
jgi:hypothetical protein